jgi:uncharacterized protein YoxC
MVNLETTNLLLGIMAAASVIQAVLLVSLSIMGFRMYRQLAQTITDLEARHIAPLKVQVDGILTDVQTITARLSQQTERVDNAINGTIERVDETAERVRHTVRGTFAQATGIVRGVRAIIMSLLTNDAKPAPPAAAAERL